MPDKIKSLGKLHKLAVLSSFLVDEGCTVCSVHFCSSNFKLLRDAISIAESLGYKCNCLLTVHPSSKNKLTNKHYKFTLSASSIEKFYLDLKFLFKEFPTLYIGKKFENVEHMVKIKNRGWNQRAKGETKQIILNSLKDKDKTAYEIRDLANISLWTTYHHLQQLIKKGKVIKYKSQLNTLLYRLV